MLAENENWYRSGFAYHEYFASQLRKYAGDLSATDRCGLEYNFIRRLFENAADPTAEKFTREEIDLTVYVVHSLTQAMDPRSKYFRKDLFK
jgi:hypothetical protein